MKEAGKNSTAEDSSVKKRTVRRLSEQYSVLDTLTIDRYKEQLGRLERWKRATAAVIRKPAPVVPRMFGIHGAETEKPVPSEPVIIVDSHGRASLPGQRIVKYISGEYTLLDLYNIEAFQADLQRREQLKSSLPPTVQDLEEGLAAGPAMAPFSRPLAKTFISESGRTLKILSSDYSVLTIMNLEAVRTQGAEPSLSSLANLPLVPLEDGQVHSRDLVPLEGKHLDIYTGIEAGQMQVDEARDQPSDADLHRGYYAFLRELALRKIRKMVLELDQIWANEMRAQEIRITRENKILAVFLAVSLIAVLTLLSFGFFRLQERTWSARFYLKSAWANEEGTVRVIVDAKGLEEEEKYEGIDEISAAIQTGSKNVPGEIMPIYMKNGDVLFVIESDEPVAMPGPCNLNVLLSKEGKVTEHTISIRNLKYEKHMKRKPSKTKGKASKT